jgi:hypothetical protein
MDRNEKKRLRDSIGEHLDISKTRLTDEEANVLGDFIDNYDSTYKGKTDTRSRTYDGWSSDGKYTRRESRTETFTDDIGIREEYEYHDDDGQTGHHTKEIKDARGILNKLKGWRNV